jgi:hypothetical protein
MNIPTVVAAQRVRRIRKSGEVPLYSLLGSRPSFLVVKGNVTSIALRYLRICRTTLVLCDQTGILSFCLVVHAACGGILPLFSGFKAVVEIEAACVQFFAPLVLVSCDI